MPKIKQITEEQLKGIVKKVNKPGSQKEIIKINRTSKLILLDQKKIEVFSLNPYSYRIGDILQKSNKLHEINQQQSQQEPIVISLIIQEESKYTYKTIEIDYCYYKIRTKATVVNDKIYQRNQRLIGQKPKYYFETTGIIAKKEKNKTPHTKESIVINKNAPKHIEPVRVSYSAIYECPVNIKKSKEAGLRIVRNTNKVLKYSNNTNIKKLVQKKFKLTKKETNKLFAGFNRKLDTNPQIAINRAGTHLLSHHPEIAEIRYSSTLIMCWISVNIDATIGHNPEAAIQNQKLLLKLINKNKKRNENYCLSEVEKKLQQKQQKLIETGIVGLSQERLISKYQNKPKYKKINQIILEGMFLGEEEFKKLKRLINAFVNKPVKKPKNFPEEVAGAKILKSKKDYINTATAMNNCIAGYLQDHQETNSSRIYYNPTEDVALMLRVTSLKKLAISQIYKTNNNPVEPSIKEKYEKELKVINNKL